MHNLNGMGWGMGYGWLIGLAIFAAVVWFIYRMVQPATGNPGFKHKSAIDILNERFARGEINEEQYNEIMRRIS